MTLLTTIQLPAIAMVMGHTWLEQWVEAPMALLKL